MTSLICSSPYIKVSRVNPLWIHTYFLWPGTGPWARPAARSWHRPCPRCGTVLPTSSSMTRGILSPRSRWRSWTWRSPRPPGTLPCRWRRPRRWGPPGLGQWGPRCSDPAKRNRTLSWSRNIQISCLRKIKISHLSCMGEYYGFVKHLRT